MEWNEVSGDINGGGWGGRKGSEEDGNKGGRWGGTRGAVGKAKNGGRGGGALGEDKENGRDRLRHNRRRRAKWTCPVLLPHKTQESGEGSFLFG